MNWKLHLLFGFVLMTTFAVTTYHYFRWFLFENILLYIAMFLIYIIAPLLPDIDYIHSKVSQIIYWVGSITGITGIAAYFLFKLNVLLLVIGFIILVSVFIIGTVFKHRGFTHSIAFILLISGVVFYYTNIQLACLNAVGMYSHMIGDILPLKII